MAGAMGASKLPVPTAPWRADPGPPMPQRGGGIEADFIVVNARVLTQDAALPRAEAFAVKDGRFLAVGSNADIRNLATARTRVIDGARMCVLPGFIDAHCHPRGVSELFEANANVRTVSELQANLRARVATTPEGHWINGAMFDDTKLDERLTIADLDAVSTRHPIAVNHRGGHTSWYNGKAFELAGVTRDTPDPTGGRFNRDANGDLDGMVAELARGVMSRGGQRVRFTPEEQRARSTQGMAHISKLLTATGLTTVHDAGADRNAIRAYEDTRAAGALRHRGYLMIRGAYEQLRDAGVYTGFGDDMIRIGGVKHSADGSASERTMRMSTPYVGTDDHGILTMTQQEIHDAVDDAHPQLAGGDPCQRRCRDRDGAQRVRARTRAMAARRPPSPDRALLTGESVHPLAHREGGRHPDTVLDLCVLPRREVGAVRGREDALDVRAPVVPRRGHPRAGRVGLRARAVRAAHGDPEHGHAPRLPRQGMGAQPEGHRRRGAADRDGERLLCVVRGTVQGDDHRGEARRLRDAREGSARRGAGHDQGRQGRADGGGGGRTVHWARRRAMSASRSDAGVTSTLPAGRQQHEPALAPVIARAASV
jgi:hypothetical protein